MEEADTCDDPEVRQELLTFVFVGGGYAGLEALAELQDFAAEAIEAYPRARLQGMRWMLVEAMDRVLPEIDDELADYALRELRGRGIDIRLGTTIEEVTGHSTRLSTGETIPTRTVVWTAGVIPHPSNRNLGLPLDERGRIVVDDHLRVYGEDDVWAIGDAAAVPDPRSRASLPADVPARDPPGPHGRPQRRRLAGRGRAGAFTYKTLGAFVNLGRYKAVAQGRAAHLRGFPAWWLARTYHVSQIPGTARKVRAVMDWTVGLPFKRDIAEVGSIGHPRPLSADAYERAGTHRRARHGARFRQTVAHAGGKAIRGRAQCACPVGRAMQ